MTDPEFILGLGDLIIYLDSSEYKTRIAMEQDFIRIKLLLDSCHQTQRCHNVSTITTKCYGCYHNLGWWYCMPERRGEVSKPGAGKLDPHHQQWL